MNNYYIQLTGRIFIVLVAIVAIVVSSYFFALYLYPFLIAFILAYLINPVVNFLTYELRFPRILSVLLSLLILLTSTFGIIIILISEIISAINYLTIKLPEQFDNIVAFIQSFTVKILGPFYDSIYENFNKLGVSQKETILDNVQNFSNNLIDSLQSLLRILFVFFTNLLTSFPSIITVVIITILATFFISNDWYHFVRYTNKLLPDKIKYFIQNIISTIRSAIFGLMKSQLTIITVTTLIVLIGLLLLKVPYAITIAILTGFIELIPYFGTGLIFVPWIIYSYLTDQLTLTLGLIILFITGIVVRQIIEPKILSSNIGLEPLPTLISLFIGVKIFGIIGLIIGPLILVILYTLHQASVFKEIFQFIIGKKK